MKSIVLICTVAFAAWSGWGLDLNEGWWSELRPEKGAVRQLENVKIPHNWEDYHDMRTLVHGTLHGSALYRRSFTAKNLSGRRSFLEFAGTGMYLSVKLNGKELCKHRPAGRLVVTVETTGVARDGENDLEVLCEHPSEIMDLPWHCGGCSGIGSEGPEALGLFRNVRFYVTPLMRIEPFGTHVWYDRGITKVFVEAEVSATTNLSAKFRVRIPELQIEGIAPVSIAAGAVGTFRQEFALSKVERWSPKNPRLYAVIVEIEGEDGEVDRQVVKTGFRSIRWPRRGDDDGRFFVNDEPVFIHGACETDNRFGSHLAFAKEEIDARVNEFEKLGFNAWRDGHEPHDLHYNERWDADGILWWPQLSTHTYFDTDEFKANFRWAVKQWIKERRNSPSVVLWGLQNESVIAQDFAEEMTALIHELDPMSGEGGRLVTTCNYGSGTDWNVIQNWCGCYTGDLEDYQADLTQPRQLLNGEYGAWRSFGFHADPDVSFAKSDPWTEEHAAFVLWQKMLRAWDVRGRTCGHFLWTFISHGRAGGFKVDEGYSLLDKFGPLNPKGIMTIDGRRVAAWYVYRSYGHHLKKGTLGECRYRPLSWWIAEGKRLEAPVVSAPLAPTADVEDVYICRLNCGGDRLVDSCGNKWIADSTAYSDSWASAQDLIDGRVKLDPLLGSRSVVEGGVVNAAMPDQPLFGTYRYGRNRLAFCFDAPANADCTVEAYFVEPGSYGRNFDIAVNGSLVEDDFILANFAGDRNVVKREWRVRSTADGKIIICFPEVKVNQAVISAIAIRAAKENVAGWTCPAGAIGYPESAGLTWGELAAQCRAVTTKSMLPPGEMQAIVPVTPLQPTPSPEDGWKRARFLLRVAGKYSVTMLVRSGNVSGKKLRWKLTSIDDYVRTSDKWICKKNYGCGEFDIPSMGFEDRFELPIDIEVNAGSYMVWYRVEGAELEAREMR